MQKSYYKKSLVIIYFEWKVHTHLSQWWGFLHTEENNIYNNSAVVMNLTFFSLPRIDRRAGLSKVMHATFPTASVSLAWYLPPTWCADYTTHVNFCKGCVCWWHLVAFWLSRHPTPGLSSFLIRWDLQDLIILTSVKLNMTLLVFSVYSIMKNCRWELLLTPFHCLSCS